MAYYEGYEQVEYTPVQAYALDSQSSNSVISGGSGDGVIVTESTTFYWRYDPDDTVSDGFTGKGWFQDREGTPLYVAGLMTEDAVIEEITKKGNLNDVFDVWRNYVAQHPEDNLVTNFVFMIGSPTCVHIGS